MAVEESKSNDCNNTSRQEAAKNISLTVAEKNAERYKFSTSDVVIYGVSLAIFLTHTLTVVTVATIYFLYDYTTWMYLTIYFAALPLAVIQTVSLRWHKSEHLGFVHWMMHILCLGMLQRYFSLLKTAVQGIKGRTSSSKSKDTVLRMKNDAFTLSLISSFIVDAPQSVVQLYILAASNDTILCTSFSILVSLSSLIWAVTIHTKFVLKTVSHKQYPTLSALTVEILWRSGFLVSRIAALVLGALSTKHWFFVLLGLHWLGMTIWLTTKKTRLCSTTWEERACDCLVGLINCFDYVKLQSSDRSWHRMCTFYSVMIAENMVFLATYILFFREAFDQNVLILCSTAIVGGTSIGLANMSLYFYMFRHTTNTKVCVLVNLKLPAGNQDQETSSKTSLSSLPHSNNLSSQRIVIPEEVTADEKSLLTNIVQSNDSMEKGIVNRSFVGSDEPEIVAEKSGQESPDDALLRQKRRGICSSMEADLEKDNLDDLGLNLRKRRGICSITQLCPEETLSNVESKDEMKKDAEKLESESKISKDEARRSHASSIHDYENLCPLGVARPPWCIRSWKGYTDIETYIHDDSVVRDRRRDTLTSTTMSSEYSDATTYASLPLRRLLRRSRQDDYLDTLAYDLVDFESNFGNLEVEEPMEPTLFAAKPVVIDEKGGMLALDTIMEEHEEQTPRKSQNPLVATIDEIRKGTAENSPRHIYYHRTEWEDLERKISMRSTRVATVLFEKNQYNDIWRCSPASFELNAIREIYSRERATKIPLIDAVLSDSPILGSRNSSELEDSIKRAEFFNLEEENNVYVDMNGGGAGTKEKSDIYENLEPVISLKPVEETEKEQTLSTEISVVKDDDVFSGEKKHKVIGRPRRKFSLLRERFEPKSDCAMHTNHWSKSSANGKKISIILSEQEAFDSIIAQEKENLTKVQSNAMDFTEKHSVFMKQILSSPKFQGWGKKRTFSPNARIIPKAV